MNKLKVSIRQKALVMQANSGLPTISTKYECETPKLINYVQSDSFKKDFKQNIQ